ncbi:MAG TPA: hypothetical protein VE646_14290 [Actinomycetota bacterium]|nr:hypothetical protein [Actinomycetota bacterium]
MAETPDEILRPLADPERLEIVGTWPGDGARQSWPPSSPFPCSSGPAGTSAV